MFARLLALVCLLQFGLRVGRSEPVLPTDRELVVYLHAGTFRASPSLPYMQSEVEALMHAAGYRVDWRIAGESSSNAEAAALVVVELRGVCQPADPAAQIDPLPNGSLLASTAVSDGHILPFSWVHCDSLTGLLGHSINGPLQDFWYGRAMGRLIAHELYHILTNQRQHVESGLAKSAFSAQDLVAEHFEFEHATLATLRELH